MAIAVYIVSIENRCFLGGRGSHPIAIKDIVYNAQYTFSGHVIGAIGGLYKQNSFDRSWQILAQERYSVFRRPNWH